MTLVLRSAKGSRLTHNEMDGNWLHAVDSVNSSFVQTGTPASGTVAHKLRQFVSVTDQPYGATGDGSTDDTVAIQAAIDAVADGGTVWFPSPAVDYKFSTLTVDKAVTLQGAGWQVRANQAFGHADWANTTFNQGSILRSTATSGVAITCNKASEALQYSLRDIAIIGPGSGTSTGILLGGATAPVMSQWRNVMVANFSKGVDFTGVIDCSFYDLRVRGNTTGIEFDDDTFQNAFYNLEVQKATDALVFIGAAQNDFFGGLVQGNTNGIVFRPDAGSLESLNFYGTWFESNTNNIVYDTTNGGVTGTLFQATRMSGGTAISYSGANTVNFPKFIGNQWSSIAVILHTTVANAVWSANNAGTLTDNGVDSQIDAVPASYTPTLTNFTATINGATFCRVGNLVYVQVLLTIVTGVPSGTLNISLPVASTNSIANSILGTVVATDTGSRYFIGAPYRSAVGAMQVHDAASGNEWNATVPHTWAVGDKIEVSLCYMA